MCESRPFDFSSFSSANMGIAVSGFDYLHAVYKSQDLPADFIFWFAKMFWPEFKTVDGVIFISEIFDPARYKELMNDNKYCKNAQFWMNLVEITGIFDGLSSDQAMIIAKILANSWSSKLYSETGDKMMIARAINDEETGEVFVTIGSHG